MSLCRHVTFYKTLTSLSTVFIKGHVGLLQLLMSSCRTSFFTHVEPYIYIHTSDNMSPICMILSMYWRHSPLLSEPTYTALIPDVSPSDSTLGSTVQTVAATWHDWRTIKWQRSTLLLYTVLKGHSIEKIKGENVDGLVTVGAENKNIPPSHTHADHKTGVWRHVYLCSYPPQVCCIHLASHLNRWIYMIMAAPNSQGMIEPYHLELWEEKDEWLCYVLKKIYPLFDS